MIKKSDYPDIKWVLNNYGEFPSTYSDNARRIISDKYFTKGESSMFSCVERICNAIAVHGYNNGYFDSPRECGDFERHLGGLLLRQEASFNSPVWFNLGVEDKPQCSACFIQSVEDDMGSILDLLKKEGMLFKYGSGTGTNFSALRGKNYPLSGGGKASGVIDFMKMFDTGAGVIKSGGKTRRAAKMVILNSDHPDIEEFIWCKAKEERRIKEQVRLGMTVEEAVERAQFQNANNSVRVTDEFMRLAEDERTTEHFLLDAMAYAAWECGDPGIQFDDTINRAMPNGLVCNSSNPCGEYMFIDDSACNLASINLEKLFPSDDGDISTFVDPFDKAVVTLITAMDIIVGLSSYPSEAIAANSHKYRPLGLGYSGLGSVLMERGFPYGGEQAVQTTRFVTERMHLVAYSASADLGKRLGCYPKGHCRNAQLTLIAPTGTISFAMDCQSTGIEPVFAERQTKNLVGGGTLEIVPDCVAKCPRKEAIKVALSDDPSKVVTPDEHLAMMIAAQPYLSGAISKTVNLPEDCAPRDIRDLYVKAWKAGLKGLAVFRNNCKAAQPLNVTAAPELESWVKPEFATPVQNEKVFPEWNNETVLAQYDTVKAMLSQYDTVKGGRRHLPTTRKSITHKFVLGGFKGYLTVGLFEDGQPGELFLNVSKEGSTIGGFADAWATAVSMMLQYGVPLSKVVSIFRGSRFDPAGFTGGEDVKSATSIVDYIAQWLQHTFVHEKVAEHTTKSTGAVCPECGSITQPTGTCQTCAVCGWGGGCS